MIVIVCIDDNFGLTFNNRRQSRDRILRSRILEKSGGKLWLNAFSAKQFSQEDGVLVEEDFLDKAQCGEYCFVENVDISPYLQKIEKIVIYKWNMPYPSDFKFKAEVLKDFTLTAVEDFAGYSHARITEEIYSR